MQVKSGYAKSKEVKEFRPMTLEEAKEIPQHFYMIDRNGNYRVVARNGKVRRWKRDTDRIEIPCKYGMYEYFTLYNKDIQYLIVEV
jgi:hypothetical protein